MDRVSLAGAQFKLRLGGDVSVVTECVIDRVSTEIENAPFHNAVSTVDLGPQLTDNEPPSKEAL